MNNLYFQERNNTIYLYKKRECCCTSCCYCFVLDDILLGKISYDIQDTLIYISDFIIKEQYRRKGYGTKLVEYLLDNIDTELELVVHCNEQSINIFKKLGFNEKEKYTILTK